MNTSNEMATGHVVCKLSVPLPKAQTFLQQVSSAHPTAVFEILAYLPGKDNLVMTSARMSCHAGIDGILEGVRNSPDVKELDVLQKGENWVNVHVVSTSPHPSVMDEAVQLGLIPDFPALIKAGVAIPTVAATDEKVQSLYSKLKEVFPGTAILSIKREYVNGPKTLLTPKQIEVFKTALASGYWDVPCRVSLTVLAKAMGVSKSTMSETLAVVESKLLHHVPSDDEQLGNYPVGLPHPGRSLPYHGAFPMHRPLSPERE